MVPSILVVLISTFVAANAEPLRQCAAGIQYIADKEDLCAFHWCIGLVPVAWRCPPGSRVPTWFETSPADSQIPCIIERNLTVSCLRCDTKNDPREDPKVDVCATKRPCRPECRCENMWAGEWHCVCPGDVVPGFIVDNERPVNYCNPSKCINGGICFSEWNDYWCKCPPTHTGKNCESPVKVNCDTVTQPTVCQACFTGPTCSDPVVNTCACNPCSNFLDTCTDSGAGQQRVCTRQSVKDSAGSPFTLMFLQNRPDSTDKRELEIYVTSAGAESQQIRVYTPFIPSTDRCYLDERRTIAGSLVARISLPRTDCYETIGSGVFDNKVLRVESVDGQDLLVYAVNRDEYSADGFLAFPDDVAGRDFYVVTHNPPPYESEFGVLALEDTTVTLTYTGSATPTTGLSNTRYTLRAGQVLQIQSTGDLTGTRVQADRNINVYSGNVRALVVAVEDPAVGNIVSNSRDHIVEQISPVTTWGKEFNVVPIPDRRVGDQLRVVAAQDGTSVTVYRRDPAGAESQNVFTLNAGQFFTKDVISGSTYRVISNNRIFVAQLTKSAEESVSLNHDPSLITVPPTAQYQNRYIITTPEFSGGSGGVKRPYNTTYILVSVRGDDRDALKITSGSTTQSLTSLTTAANPWRQVPRSDYYSAAIRIPAGTSRIFHDSPNVNYMCLFYGFDDRESIGYAVGQKLLDLL